MKLDIFLIEGFLWIKLRVQKLQSGLNFLGGISLLWNQLTIGTDKFSILRKNSVEI
jgi:hypothetical protein